MVAIAMKSFSLTVAVSRSLRYNRSYERVYILLKYGEEYR